MGRAETSRFSWARAFGLTARPATAETGLKIPPDPNPAGATSQTVYVTGHVPAGGPVSTAASCEVRSDTTSRGATPSAAPRGDSRACDAPSSTGRRPVREIEATNCESASGEAPAADAAG